MDGPWYVLFDKDTILAHRLACSSMPQCDAERGHINDVALAARFGGVSLTLTRHIEFIIIFSKYFYIFEHLETHARNGVDNPIRVNPTSTVLVYVQKEMHFLVKSLDAENHQHTQRKQPGGAILKLTWGTC